jgi:hypothetical protein
MTALTAVLDWPHSGNTSLFIAPQHLFSFLLINKPNKLECVSLGSFYSIVFINVITTP